MVREWRVMVRGEGVEGDDEGVEGGTELRSAGEWRGSGG